MVRSIMQTEFPDGFDVRVPGKKNTERRKGHLTGQGIFQELHCDGHEKLSAKALQMGPVGIDIYGFRCHSSGMIISKHAVPNSRCKWTVAHCYLDVLERYGST